MNLPNLLNLAMSVIPKQTVQYSRFAGTTTNPNGATVNNYATAVPVVGSFQPVSRSAFQALGLDLNKDYCQFYTSTDMQDIRRDCAGDQFVFAGDTYHVLSNTEWNKVNGWNASMAVKVSP